MRKINKVLIGLTIVGAGFATVGAGAGADFVDLSNGVADHQHRHPHGVAQRWHQHGERNGRLAGCACPRADRPDGLLVLQLQDHHREEHRQRHRDGHQHRS